MALHDYRCPTCGHVERDVNVPIAIGAQRGAPNCPWHDLTTTPVRMDWIPQVGRMDAYEPFQEFEATDCYGKPVLVESMTQLRKIEEESEREYRHGPRDEVGNPVAQLQIWRDYSQDKSNSDQHTFASQMDRPMDMQGEPRLEADGSKFGKHAVTEKEAEQVAGKDVAYSAGDTLGDSAV